MWRWSLEGLPFKGHHYFIPTFSIDNDKTGVSLLSKYEAKKAKGFHSNFYEPFIISPKSYLVLEFDTVALINVHALNFVTFSEWKSELDRLVKTSEKFIKEKTGLVVAGDFNTWNEERYNYLKTKFREIGLQEVTFKKDKRTKTLGFPLDGVFSYGYRLRDSNVFEVENFSDHNALEVVLELKPFN
jgi:endonuclease/exonuclease/phosphatase (EEP) superfamily protein YafD